MNSFLFAILIILRISNATILPIRSTIITISKIKPENELNQKVNTHNSADKKSKIAFFNFVLIYYNVTQMFEQNHARHATSYYHDKHNKIPHSSLCINFKTSGYRLVEHENLCDCSPFLNDRNKVITEANADLFMRIFDDPHIELTPNEEEIAANLISLDYIHKKDGGLYLAMPVMTGQQLGEVKAIVNREMSQLYVKYYEQVVDAGNRIVLPHIRKDMTEEFVHWLMPGFFSPVNWMLYYGLYSDEHPLDIPDDYSKSSKGICIYVTKY